MNTKETNVTKKNRIYFLDNLRTFIIFLVILYHAGGVYESSGLWASFWIVDDPTTNDLVGLLNIVIDIFIMPMMFLISGYFTPISLQNKSDGAFLKGKFKRLIIPWTAVIFIFIPLYKVIFLYSRNLLQEQWTTYFHFSQGNLSGQSWLWFLPLLFLFNLIYLLLAKVNLLPVKMSVKVGVTAVFLISFITSFSIELLNLDGWTLTPFLDFQNERVIMYFLVFLLGSLFFQQQSFATKPTDKKWYTAVNVLVWIPLTIYMLFLIFPFVAQKEFMISPVADMFITWLTFYFSLLGLLYLFIETFWRYVDKTGTVWRELNQNSYYVYLIHVIVMGVIATLLLNLNVPSLLKYLTLTLATFVVSNLIVSLYHRATKRSKHPVDQKTKAAA